MVLLLTEIVNTPTTVAGVLVLLGGAVITWLLADRQRLIKKLEKETEEKESLLKEQISITKELAEISAGLAQIKK